MASIYDSIINGSFASLGPSATGWTAPGQSYAGQETGRDPNRLYPSSAGLPNPSPGSGMTPAQVAAAQMGVYGNPTTGGLPASASAYGPSGGVSMPRPRPAGAPTSIDMAAINGQPGVTRVSSAMQPGQGQGGLLELLMGQSKNGQRGLLGLLGGPQQGGLLQMLMGGRKPAAQAQQGGVDWRNVNTAGMTPVQSFQAMGMSAADAYDAANQSAKLVARLNAGKAPLYQDPNGGAHQDYGGTGAGSDHPFFSSGF